MRIGIIGMGVVGKATAKTFKYIGHNIIAYDKYQRNPVSDVHNILGLHTSDMIFICLPTPSNEEGIDMTAFDEVFPQLKGYEGLIVIKSTVLPGTCRKYALKYKLKIAHNPEFLTAKNADFDSINPHKIVIGTNDLDAENLLQELYKPFPCPKFSVNLETAEMIKYACNCELAMQVSYANELYDIANKFNADYIAIQLAMLTDDRIGKFKEVTKERGFGGMCFPKDTLAFYKATGSKMVRATIKVNQEVRNENS